MAASTAVLQSSQSLSCIAVSQAARQNQSRGTQTLQPAAELSSGVFGAPRCNRCNNYSECAAASLSTRLTNSSCQLPVAIGSGSGKFQQRGNNGIASGERTQQVEGHIKHSTSQKT